MTDDRVPPVNDVRLKGDENSILDELITYRQYVNEETNALTLLAISAAEVGAHMPIVSIGLMPRIQELQDAYLRMSEAVDKVIAFYSSPDMLNGK